MPPWTLPLIPAFFKDFHQLGINLITLEVDRSRPQHLKWTDIKALNSNWTDIKALNLKWTDQIALHSKWTDQKAQHSKWTDQKA